MMRPTRLWVVLAANLGLVGALVVVGITAHSLGVWAEGVDYLADAAAIGAALLSLHLAAPTPARPGGRPKATRYAALINAGWVLALAVLVTVGSVIRLASGVRRVDGLPVLIASGVAAAVMAAGAVLLGGDIDDGDREDGDGDPAGGGELALRAVLLDTIADAAAAAGVAAAGGVILATGALYWLDPAVALVVSGVVGVQALRLLVRIRASLGRGEGEGAPGRDQGRDRDLDYGRPSRPVGSEGPTEGQAGGGGEQTDHQRHGDAAEGGLDRPLLGQPDRLVGEGRKGGEGAAEAGAHHLRWQVTEPVVDGQGGDHAEQEAPGHVDQEGAEREVAAGPPADPLVGEQAGGGADGAGGGHDEQDQHGGTVSSAVAPGGVVPPARPRRGPARRASRMPMYTATRPATSEAPT